MRFRDALLPIAALLILEAAAGSQPNGLPPVPQGLPAQASSALTKQRATVVAEGDRLQSIVEKHHTTCAHVGLPLPSGQTPPPDYEALKERCESEQASIDKQVKQYAADAAAYRNAVDSALATTAVANKAYPARVVLKGGVRLESSGLEQTLTSSRVVQLTSGARIVTAPHARAAFSLPGGAEFILGPEAQLVLGSMVYDSSPSRRRIELRLTKGTLRWVSSGAGADQAGQPSVALASNTVRLGACDMQASMGSDSSGYIVSFKGDVRIEESKGGRTASLKGQEIVTFGPSGALAQPAPLQSGQVKSL
ncbi:MAG: hypothetical protein JOZ50_11180 [Candidatus Eremiobacteraeota bacterium]|nr:hypothetical protein [Candidatus Eremiobacteraeota bacterium]